MNGIVRHNDNRFTDEQALELAAGETEDQPECEGHPAGPFDPMGVTMYCDGSCNF